MQQAISLLFRRLSTQSHATLTATVETNGQKNIDRFLTELLKITKRTHNIAQAIDSPDGPVGYVQLHRKSNMCGIESIITVHRIQTIIPRPGGGSKMLRQICKLADREGIFVHLKIAPQNQMTKDEYKIQKGNRMTNDESRMSSEENAELVSVDLRPHELPRTKTRHHDF